MPISIFLYLPVSQPAGLRVKADTNFIEYSFICCVSQCIVHLLNLSECRLRAVIPLKLKNIQKPFCFDEAIYSARVWLGFALHILSPAK